MDIIKEWAGENRNKECSSKDARGVVWISDTLCMDLNIPLATEQPSSVVQQVFFLGEGLPTFLLTLHKAPPTNENEAERTRVKTFTVHTARLLTRLLHRFSSHCDFVMLPCTLAMTSFSATALKGEVKERQDFSRNYFGGPKELTEYMFDALLRAARAIASMSYVPCFWKGDKQVRYHSLKLKYCGHRN